MSTKPAIETVATATTPVPITVSGATILGITVNDWVLLGTALLVTFQLIVIAPKVFQTIRGLIKKKEK